MLGFLKWNSTFYKFSFIIEGTTEKGLPIEQRVLDTNVGKQLS